MPIEYVYALHDFEPLNDDEIAFVAGERIEVLERDDAYGDGWWTGRNLAGHEGIFPRDYTTPAGPLIPELRTPGGTIAQDLGPSGHSTSSFHSGNYGSTLHPLTEENESDTAPGPSNGRLNDPSSYQKTNNLVNGGGQVMAATMTDVQHAIDQLGVKRSYSTLTDDRMTDDRRSASFVSRDDRTSIYDHEGRFDDIRRDSMYEGEEGMDATPGGNNNRVTLNEEWHRNARRRLFEKVDEMDAEARRKAEEEEATYANHYHRPPVEVEFSDESEDEDGHHHYHHHNVPPNDLLSRIQHKHDDSIPSTLPETFLGDHSTTSLPFVKDEGTENAGVPSATANARHLTDSPAKADSPTLAISRHETLESNKGDLSTASPDAEAQDKRAVTPVPAKKSDELPQKVKELSITNTSKPSNEPTETKRDSAELLPALVPTSPFAPSPFVPTTPGTADSRTQGNYPISSSTIYPATQPARDASPSQPVSKSPSYISFLPSPTAATFAAAPSGNVDQPPVSNEGISQSQSQSSDPEKVVSENGYSTRANDLNSSQAKPPIGQTAVAPSITSTSLAPPSSNVPSSQASPQSTKKVPVSEWTVEQVVDWIRSKGFDEGICKKFLEHEITGDVLLEFDANMLKEIDIVAFGKRVKIANAINELRRPPSFESSDAASLKPSVSQFSMVGNQSTYSSVPQSVSLPQLATAPGHSHSFSHSTRGYDASISSAAPSVGSPNIFGVLQAQQAQGLNQVPGGGGYSPNLYNSTPEPQRASNVPHTHTRVDSDPGTSAVGEAARMIMAMNGYNMGDRAATVGHSASRGKNRPLSLALSPSEGNLGSKGIVPVVVEEEDDRSALSDSDLKKRKKDIKSLDSGVTHEPPDTPRSDTPSRASGRVRSSLDTKAGDRLSFFSAIARSRKPAPRYSSDQSGSDIGSPNITEAEKQRAHSKLYLGGATRPPRVGKSKEDKEKEKKEKEERERAKREAKEKEQEKARENSATGPAAAALPGTVLRKRTLTGESRTGALSGPNDGTRASTGAVTLKPGENVLQQLNQIVGEADHSGFMLKKGERYNTWKTRFFFLKGPHLYYLRGKQETRIKGYINIRGYKVIADEATHPGRYGFRIVHDTQKPHFFSSDDQSTIREWMKALMKATIDRDYARPVVSSANIATIPLTVAQAMNPAPRPPSPGAIAAAQRASRTDGNGLSSRDAKVLMGIADGSAIMAALPISPVPSRPSREMRRPSLANRSDSTSKGGSNAALIQWINAQLPDDTPYATDLSTSLSSGLILFRLAESIKYGREVANARLRSPSPGDPTVPDNFFDNGEERVEGLIKLFDFLLDNDVKLSGITMADIKEGRSDKIITLVRSMKQWQEKRNAVAKSVGVGGQANVMTWIQTA
ncbi:hypothetical protein CPB86DRAFT_804075 [Serendipita vermifera]|nr:hypothetical protein CPB86DRAFT_804075 [Serendipita vermifera]